MYGKEPDMAKVAQYTSTLSAKFKAYDRILAKSAFIAGDALTIADLWHAPTLTLLGKVCDLYLLSRSSVGTVFPASRADRTHIGKDAELKDGSLPHLARWWTAVQETKAGSMSCRRVLPRTRHATGDLDRS